MLWTSTRQLSAQEDPWLFPNRLPPPSPAPSTALQGWAHSLSIRLLPLPLFLLPSVEVSSMARHLHRLDHRAQREHPSVGMPRKSPQPLRFCSHVPLPWAIVDLNPTTVGLCCQLYNLVHLREPTPSRLLSPFYNDPRLDSARFLVVHLRPCVELNPYAISPRWTRV
jgi:hypothetical protein